MLSQAQAASDWLGMLHESVFAYIIVPSIWSKTCCHFLSNHFKEFNYYFTDVITGSINY
jgi:hypothetical protein